MERFGREAQTDGANPAAREEEGQAGNIANAAEPRYPELLRCHWSERPALCGHVAGVAIRRGSTGRTSLGRGAALMTSQRGDSGQAGHRITAAGEAGIG